MELEKLMPKLPTKAKHSSTMFHKASNQKEFQTQEANY